MSVNYVRENTTGHRVEGVWVFGGVEIIEKRKFFVVTVNKRDSVTLNDLIIKHVLPAFIVVTDSWKGYDLF